MALQVNTNVNDTAISGAPTTLTVPVLNWLSDYNKVQDIPNVAILGYKRSPVDAQQTVKFAVSQIANIYGGTTVDPSYQLPNKRGVSMLAQLNQVVTVTDSVDPTYRVDLPISAHVVIRVPLTSLVNESVLFGAAQRAVACLLDRKQSGDTYRFSQMLRGTMVPDGL